MLLKTLLLAPSFEIFITPHSPPIIETWWARVPAGLCAPCAYPVRALYKPCWPTKQSKFKHYSILNCGKDSIIDWMKWGLRAHYHNTHQVLAPSDLFKDRSAILTWHYRMYLCLDRENETDLQIREWRYYKNRRRNCRSMKTCGLDGRLSNLLRWLCFHHVHLKVCSPLPAILLVTSRLRFCQTLYFWYVLLLTTTSALSYHVTLGVALLQGFDFFGAF